MRNTFFLMALSVLLVSCGSSEKKAESGLITFIVRHERTVVPLSEQIDRSFWEYAQTGSESVRARIDSLKAVKIEYLHNEKSFAYLKQLRESGLIKDEYLKRQLEILYRQYLPCQADLNLQKRIGGLQSYLKNEVWKKTKDNRPYGHSDTASYMFAGRKAMCDSLMLLVRLRNEWARQTGFADYYALQFFLNEQEQKKIDSLFSVLEWQTGSAYFRMKKDMRDPVHYRGVFSQYGQRYDNLRRNNVYAYVNMPHLAIRFFSGIGFELEEVLANSDFSRSGLKLPIVRCVPMNRKGDIRLIGRLNGTETDMLRLLACCGEAAYWKSIPNTLPYMLRSPSSFMLQVGVGSFFSRLVGYPDWLLSMGVFSAGQAGALRGSTHRELVREQLLFCRWALLMYHFERALYARPDSDLSALWVDLNRRYLGRDCEQEIRCKGRICSRYARSEWITEPYLLLDACQMHHYLLAELWAAQVTGYLCRTYPRLGSPCNPELVGDKEVGAYFRKHVFEPGAGKHWEELTREATGKALSVEDFVEQFCQIKE
ncbi:MAG: hypothetical protein K2I87_05260 [Bacteroidales bacterium]|nr:hypothetical protein [Bacteroidales bacterium]